MPRYGRIPATAILDNTLTLTQSRVLQYLGMRAAPDGWCICSQMRIAKDLAIHRQTVNAALATLEEAGYIRQVRRRRNDGGQACSHYQVVFEDEPESSDHDRPCHDSFDTQDSLNNPFINNSPLKSPQGDFSFDLEEDDMTNEFPPYAFNLFWQAYPRKVGKDYAKKCFDRKFRPKSGPPPCTFDEMMDGLRQYIEITPDDCPWCNPSTWINQGRWTDGGELQRGTPAGEREAYMDELRRRGNA